MQSLIKINRNGMRKEDDEIVQTVLNAVKVRNETLKIADKHPGVFSFLDSKKQAEASKYRRKRRRLKRRERRLLKAQIGPFVVGTRRGDPIPAPLATPPDSSHTSPVIDKEIDAFSRLKRLTKSTAEKNSIAAKPLFHMRSRRSLERRMSKQEMVNITQVQFTITSLCGRLSNLIALVLDTILYGYTIPFDEAPEPPSSVENRKSALNNAKFVDDTNSELVTNGAVQIVARSQPMDLMIHPLSVAEGKKLRLVLDLSYLNRYVTKEHVKFDDLERVKHLLPPGGYMTSFDLKSGYHHIRVAQRSQRYLGFEWVLPFRPFLRPTHIHQIAPAINPLMDGLIWGCSREECERVSKDIRKDLKSFVWFEAEGKCNWLPAAETKWLGFVINLKSYEISISMDRTEKALAILKRMLFERAPSLHTRMRWMGTLASLSIVISDLNKRQSRAMTASVAEAQSRECSLSYRWTLSSKERREISYWIDSLTTGISVSLYPPAKPPEPNFIIEVDASAHSGSCWSGVITRQHVGFAKEPTGTSRRHLGAAEPFRGEQNRLADKESRQLDFDSWRVNKRTTNKVQERWLHCEIDMFADDKNTICQRFFSRAGAHAHRGSTLFSQHSLWLVPSPPNLVSRTLSWARHFGSFGILGCPYWPSQAYFLILKPDGKNWANFVRDGAFFPVGSKIFTPCPHSNIFNSEFSRIRFMFLLIDFPRVSFPTKSYDILTVRRRLRSTNALLRCRNRSVQERRFL
ncbi:hypothetical protein COOONC_05364 [Cooperia oncophora]